MNLEDRASNLVQMVEGLLDLPAEQIHMSTANSWAPVHTAYIPPDALLDDPVATWSAAALNDLAECGRALSASAKVTRLVETKLSTEPVEDIRIDFEDGYKGHPDEEDWPAESIASIRSTTRRFGPGIRPLEPRTTYRALRAPELFMSSSDAEIVVTLPKARNAAQVRALVAVCESLESSIGRSHCDRTSN